MPPPPTPNKADGTPDLADSLSGSDGGPKTDKDKAGGAVVDKAETVQTWTTPSAVPPQTPEQIPSVEVPIDTPTAVPTGAPTGVPADVPTDAAGQLDPPQGTGPHGKHGKPHPQ